MTLSRGLAVFAEVCCETRGGAPPWVQLFRSTQKRHTRVDEEFVNIAWAREGKRGLLARGQDGAKKYRAARAGARIKRHRGDERPRHARLIEFAANLITLVAAAGGEFHLVAR